jgi:membrane associated rhomboid family serine protease
MQQSPTSETTSILTHVYERLLKDQFDQITTPKEWNLWSLLFFVPITVLLITCHVYNTKHPEKNLVSRLGFTKNIIYETRDRKKIRGGTDVGETYRLWSVGFVHASWAHLWTNMILLWTAALFFVMCPTLMHGYHASQLYFLYFISQVGSSAVSLSQDTSTDNQPHGTSVGASGAIWGLWGAIFQRFFQHVVVRSGHSIPLHMVFLLFYSECGMVFFRPIMIIRPMLVDSSPVSLLTCCFFHKTLI